MANQNVKLQSNLVEEELSDADLMAVVGGAVGDGGGTLGTGVSGQQTTAATLRAVNVYGTAVLIGGQAALGYLAQQKGISDDVGTVTG